MSSPLVWLITGTSSGLGKRLVVSALERGDYVIATARSLATIQTPDFFAPTERLRCLELDVTWSPSEMEPAVERALGYYGRIDVLVNNAGWVLKSLIEDCGVEEFREQFDCNFFGVVRLTNLILPGMRQRREGCIVMIGSRTSWMPELPSTALYASSKAALRAYSETLASEVEPLSIRVLIVEPGALRTEGIVSARRYLPLGTIPEYQEVRRKVESHFNDGVEGKQRGDPQKAAEVIVNVVRGEGLAADRPWPLYLPLGVDGIEGVEDKCHKMLKVVKEWKDMAEAIDVVE
ncbi:hypothetical protein V5O48_009084 [Marasmius crinis-equi]|uniref:NAD(P)-binding protein n=1 Tax=Marasmius crinis-equi TaxID=585013 RepID=A0ABR3FCE4_9AGAR